MIINACREPSTWNPCGSPCNCNVAESASRDKTTLPSSNTRHAVALKADHRALKTASLIPIVAQVPGYSGIFLK